MALRDLARRQIEADERAGRKTARHGGEIGAHATAKLQHAAVFHRLRAKAEKGGEDGEPVRVRVLAGP